MLSMTSQGSLPFCRAVTELSLHGRGGLVSASRFSPTTTAAYSRISTTPQLRTATRAMATSHARNKANVLIIGSGGVGTMAAYALEKGGKASVTAVLRSNYEAVKQNGFNIRSIQHGDVDNWRPSSSELRAQA